MAEKDRARVTEKATWALAVALLAGVAFTMRSAHEVDGLAAPLATASAPRRLISLELVRGSAVDFVEDLGGAAFKVTNPNAQSGCGCGSSFSV